MTYAEAKAFQDSIYARMNKHNAILKSFPKGRSGVTPDAVRATHEYQAAKIGYDFAFAELRKFNETFVKRFDREIRAERQAKREARLRVASV